MNHFDIKKIIDKNNLTTNIEQEIIVLLDKKYNNKRLDYNDNSYYYFNGINREILETQINFRNTHFYYTYKNGLSIYNINEINKIDTLKLIIDAYLEIDVFLCYYDIDILNLVIKHIIINRDLPEKIVKEDEKNNCVYSYFFPQEKQTLNIKKNLDYFINKYSKKGLEKKTLTKFFFIVEEIIIPLSTYELI